MFDFVLLFIEFVFAEKVVDGFVVLHKQEGVVKKWEGETVKGIQFQGIDLPSYIPILSI